VFLRGGFIPKSLHMYATVLINKKKKHRHVYVLNTAVPEIKSIKCIKNTTTDYKIGNVYLIGKRYC
jgi:CRISPR/Cas system-associated protein endoribonuclease Cas2